MPLHAAALKGFSLLLLVLVAWGAAPAYAVDFNALWEHQQIGGDNIDSASRFQQRYSLGLGPSLTYQLTPAIFAGANLSYARTERDIDGKSTTIEEITPSAQMGVTNDIFRAVLSGMVTEYRPVSGDEFTSYTWDATLGSNWRRDLWPNITFNYLERSEEDRGRDDELVRDNDEKFYSATLDWDLRLARLYYDYANGQIDDLLNSSRNDRESHLVRLESRQSFWQNRIRFNLSQQFQQTDNDFIMLTPDGLFELSLTIDETRSLVVASAGTPLPDDPTFESLFGDQFADGLPGPIENDERVHLVASFNFPQQVDRLDLYLGPQAVDGSQVAALPWDLYVRSGGIWVLAAANLPAEYNFFEERVELTIDLAEPAREMMVVADVSGLTDDLVISRIDAISRINVDTNTRQQSYLTNASLRIQLTRTLVAASSLILDRTESLIQPLADGEDDGQAEGVPPASEVVSIRRTLSGNLHWTPTPFVAPSVGYSETRQDISRTPDEISRSYSATVATYPLPTLNVTLGVTRTDRFEGEEKIATTDNYGLTSTASIYPDLTASLNANYITSDREQDDGTMVTTDTISSRLTLNARLTPRLIADLATNFRDSERNNVDSTTTADSTLNLLWRPSDLLMMRASGTKHWTGIDSPEPLALAMEVALLRTYNTRLNFLYNHSRGRETSNQFSLNGSWDISRALSLQGRFTYRSAEFDSWNTLVRLALRL